MAIAAKMRAWARRAKKAVRHDLRKRVRRLEAKSSTEERRLTTNLAYGCDPAANTVTPLSYTAEGDDYPDRSGNKIFCKRLSGRIRLYNSAANLYTTSIRVVFFIDRENTGVIPAANNVFPSATSTSMTAEQSYVNRPRYKIIYDKTYIISATHGLDTSNKVININKKINMPIHYLDTAANAASQGKNGLYMLTISSSTTAAQFVSVDGNIYMRFTP